MEKPEARAKSTWSQRINAYERRLVERTDAERERHSSVDVTLTAVDRDSDVGGGIMAGALAYRMFIWLLPFALVLIGVLGVTADVTDESPSETAGGAGLSGLVTTSVASAAQGTGRWYAVAIGLPILLWTTRSLLRALISVHRLVWADPRERVVKATWAGTVRLLTALVVLYFLGPVIDSIWPLDGDVVVVVFAEAALYAVLWLLVTLRLPHRNADWRGLLPGAVLFAAGGMLLATLTYYVIGPYASSREDTYGTLGLATALLLGLFLIARLVVASAVLNATLWERRPREAGEA